MTATDVLRRMLDERGGFRVDFDREGARRTCWKIDDEQDGYCYFDEDAFGVTQFTVTRVTPAQAIAATLGDSDATGERRCDVVEVVRCRDCACFSVDDSDHDYRTGWWCKRWYTDMVMPDGFCAWASRKESE